MSATGLTSREIALAISPHLTGGLSMISSSYIAYTILSSRQKRSKTYHRLLLAMSLSDIIGSFSYFLSTWAIPQVGPEGVGGWSKACEGCSPHHYEAGGNAATCTAQGWGIQMGTMTTATYNVVLAVHYLLTIRWNFSERRLKKWEPLMLAMPPVVGLGVSLPQIPLDYYNDTNLWCWIKAGWEYEDAVQRTYNARWAFAFAPLWAFIVFITLAQLYLWYTVREIERRCSRYRKFSSVREQSSQSRSVAQQAALYVMGFYATNLPYTVIAATQRFYNPHTTGGFLALLAVVVFAPLQGFWNLFVYRRKTIFVAVKNSYAQSRDAISSIAKDVRSSVAKDARTTLSKKGKAPNVGNGPDEKMDTEKDPNVQCSDNTKDKSLDEEKAKSAEDIADFEDDGIVLPGERDPFIPTHVSEVYAD